VPALVDRPQIVVSAGANEVRLEEFHRWAAPLQEELSRVIAADLMVALDTPRVSVLPRRRKRTIASPSRCSASESAPGGIATLDAAWNRARRRMAGEHPGAQQRARPVQSAGYEALAAAHGRAAARMSQDIAGAIRGLEQP